MVVLVSTMALRIHCYYFMLCLSGVWGWLCVYCCDLLYVWIGCDGCCVGCLCWVWLKFGGDALDFPGITWCLYLFVWCVFVCLFVWVALGLFAV